jgi:RNA polymerase sigma-70 factor (ECF subfamily)
MTLDETPSARALDPSPRSHREPPRTRGAAGDQDETSLLAAVRQGDLEAFNRLVLRHQDRIFNHALWLLGDHAAAEDVTQDAFVRAFQRFKQFRGGSFRSWVLKIATNLSYDEMRYRKRRPAQPLEPEDEYGETIESPYWIRDTGPLPEESVEMTELGETLQNALNQLPAQYRAAITLVDIQELDYLEAAEVMSVSIGTVKSRVARGRSLLRTALKGHEPHRSPTRAKMTAH